MLVLSRWRDETIMIGDDIELTIVDIRGDKVRVGISAPNSVSVHRKEVYEAIRKERAGRAFRGDLSPSARGRSPRAVNGGTVPPAARLAARTENRR